MESANQTVPEGTAQMAQTPLEGVEGSSKPACVATTVSRRYL
ncbi:hypothetical protein [Geodermatophilus sp. URMC 64]